VNLVSLHRRTARNEFLVTDLCLGEKGGRNEFRFASSSRISCGRLMFGDLKNKKTQ
jgi:hypothetical protein